MRAKKARGFTLIEMMIVVVIIAALAAMVVPNWFAHLKDAKTNIAKGDLGRLRQELAIYRVKHNAFPTTAQGLGALGLEDKPVDPWGRPYQYRCPGTQRPSDYDLFSLGEDGQAGTADDVTNWK